VVRLGPIPGLGHVTVTAQNFGKNPRQAPESTREKYRLRWVFGFTRVCVQRLCAPPYLVDGVVHKLWETRGKIIRYPQ
jgi:hypothetical protein